MSAAYFQTISRLLPFVFILAACNDGSSSTPSNSSGTATPQLYLNDTGVTQFTQQFPVRAVGSATPAALSNVPDTAAIGQDAETGNDISNGTNSADGKLGFRFLKLDSNGSALSNQSYPYLTLSWSCVKDETTGLIWEVKTTDGLQFNKHKYSWYEPDNSVNGGNAGDLGNTDTCNNTLTYCNTHHYITAINNLNNGRGLCGLKNWRLPLREELRSLIDYSITSGAMIDTNFFPNTEATDTWTSQTAYYDTQDGSDAWEIHFDKGRSEGHKKSSDQVVVRLVHDPEN